MNIISKKKTTSTTPSSSLSNNTNTPNKRNDTTASTPTTSYIRSTPSAGSNNNFLTPPHKPSLSSPSSSKFNHPPLLSPKTPTTSGSGRIDNRTPSSKLTTPKVYQVVNNAALSSSERNAEQCTRAIKHFVDGKFELTKEEISQQPTKSFLSKLLLYKSCYHMGQINDSLKVLKYLHNDATTMGERGEEDVIAGVQICLMIAQVVLFKILPKRLKLQCLLIEEENEISTTTTGSIADSDMIVEYLEKVERLLNKSKEDLKKLKMAWKLNENSIDSPLDVSSIMKQLNWFIVFFKGVIHLRRYEYLHTNSDLEEWKRVLKTIYNKGEFLHVDFFYLFAHLAFMDGDLENALIYLNKAERSVEHCKQTMKEQVGGVNATDSMWLLDDSALSFDVFDMIQELKSKCTLSQYLENRVILRELDPIVLQRFIKEIKSINSKRRQHNAKLVEQTQKFDEFLGTLAQTSFKDFNCSIIEKFRTYGQYKYVVHLAKKLLNDKDLPDRSKITSLNYLIEALYYLKRFGECVSTYCANKNLLPMGKNSSTGVVVDQQQQLLKQPMMVNYFVVDSFITTNLEGGHHLNCMNIQEAENLIKENLNVGNKDARQLNLILRLYKLKKSEMVVDKIMSRLFTLIQNSSTHVTYDEFFSTAEQYYSRPFIIQIGTSKSLTATPNKSTINKQGGISTPNQTIFSSSNNDGISAAVDELVTLSTFEDFAPQRCKDKINKQNNALSEMKRQLEAAKEKSSKKKVKLE